MLRAAQTFLCLLLLAVVGPLGAISLYRCSCTGALLSSTADCRCPCSERALASDPAACGAHECSGDCATSQDPDPDPGDDVSEADSDGSAGDCNELLFQGREVGFHWERVAFSCDASRLASADPGPGSPLSSAWMQDVVAPDSHAGNGGSISERHIPGIAPPGAVWANVRTSIRLCTFLI